MDKSDSIPLMVQILWDARRISPVDVSSFMALRQQFPSKSESDLLLESGLVTDRELESLELATDILGKSIDIDNNN